MKLSILNILSLIGVCTVLAIPTKTITHSESLNCG